MYLYYSILIHLHFYKLQRSREIWRKQLQSQTWIKYLKTILLFFIFCIYAPTLSYTMLQKEGKVIHWAWFMSLLPHSSSGQWSNIKTTH